MPLPPVGNRPSARRLHRGRRSVSYTHLFQRDVLHVVTDVEKLLQVPVSYTHLDVYKRQHIDRYLGYLFRQGGEGGTFNRYHFHILSFLLDVYKRQDIHL